VRVLLTGGRGMLGSSIAEQWALARPDDELVAIGRADLDLRDRAATERFVADAAPDAIIHAAAHVGGIAAKIAQPTGYLYDNLLIDTSVIGAALATGVGELLYVASAAMYPEHYRQPFVEGDILAAPLEAANEGYAIAKIAGTKLCEYASREFGHSYRVAIPSNLYGPNDNHALGSAHLIAAAIAKVHEAQQGGDPVVTVWGDGTARREFTYSVDLAAWLVGQVGRLSAWPPTLNLGVGVDHSISEYYKAACAVVGYTGELQYDTSKPAGMPQRILDSSAARRLGWSPRTALADGMAEVYRSFLTTDH
jgi:GDP-L-fucose synthase